MGNLFRWYSSNCRRTWLDDCESTTMIVTYMTKSLRAVEDITIEHIYGCLRTVDTFRDVRQDGEQHL